MILHCGQVNKNGYHHTKYFKDSEHSIPFPNKEECAKPIKIHNYQKRQEDWFYAVFCK